MINKKVDEFEYKGHNCVIINCQLGRRSTSAVILARGSAPLRSYHNGYVKVAEDEKESNTTYHEYIDKVETAELTFSGELNDMADGYYFGFDTAHGWNIHNPESQTAESVKERLKELVDEFEEKNIFQEVSEGDE